MITVAVHPDKHPAVEEFFELFKTEWSFHDPEGRCDVLLTDDAVPPDTQATLCILFSSAGFPGDQTSRIASTPDCGFRLVQMPDGNELPLYHAARWFSGAEQALITEKETGQTVAYSEVSSGTKIVRVGYDLFDEVAHLLSSGQPPENAGYPTFDRHIAFLRQSILDAGIPVVEIPPCPPGYDFMVCLTHDVDFVRIRNHGLDNTVRGFVYRAVIGSVQRFLKHRLTVRQVLTNWLAVLSLPLVHLGVRKDFWMEFDHYRRIEEPYRSTFFLIPFRDRSGKNVSDAHPERRATRYDVTEIGAEVSKMQSDGWEFGLHGIDAWCDESCARLEKDRIESVTEQPACGVRMHWLCRNAQTEELLDTAGFEFDSTCGYNETIGFRAGTSQVFRPLYVNHLLELPLHIQDVALFYPAFLNLEEPVAWERCMDLLEHQRESGGVVTVLWHMRSLAPERLWDNFYQRLLDEFSLAHAWVGTARQAAGWFRMRREINLSTCRLSDGQLSVQIHSESEPGRAELTLRIYHPGSLSPGLQPSFTDITWDGRPEVRIHLKGKKRLNRPEKSVEVPA
jgi:hypothetical protein